ncbi:MAG TPA: hypothetical protein DHV48_16675 [Prolixibacteraceae bacterium]|nr:hypothetical protein [Prolixibacteraceae bacterium]
MPEARNICRTKISSKDWSAIPAQQAMSGGESRLPLEKKSIRKLVLFFKKITIQKTVFIQVQILDE